MRLEDTALIKALKEDIGHGDITTSLLIAEGHKSTAVLIARENFILAGTPFAEKIFKLIDSEINPVRRNISNRVKFKADKKDRDAVKAGSVIARISGNTRCLLTAERVALNLLQRLSGIATLTHRFVEKVKGLPVKIVGTRKTTPGFRFFEKYAVRVGGGSNHRFGLFDGVLIKDNHIAVAGGIKKAIKLARAGAQHMLKIEVEVSTIRELEQALSAGADIIMLDNMSIKEMRKAVKIVRLKSPGTILEASGNITTENVRATAQTGVDLISIGALTHSATAVDISMEIMPSR